MRAGHFLVVFLIAAACYGQQVAVIVPNSTFALNRSFVFSDTATNSLLVLYEKRQAGALALEIRRPDNLKITRRYSPKIRSGELLRQAVFVPQVGIVAVVQDFPELSSLIINPQTGAITRNRIYTMEEAQSIDRTVQRIDTAGLAWNARANSGSMLLNLQAADRTLAFLVTLDATGRRMSAPSRIDSGKGAHTDLVYNSCQGGLAATTENVVRILRSPNVKPLYRPEEISFDPDLCRYFVVRRPFNEIPEAYYINPNLSIQSFRELPGSVAPQLIAESRNQAIYNAERRSFIYPTWADHQRIYINEITPSGIRTSLLQTPIDASSMSVSSRGTQVHLLLSGLQFGTYERLHRLILVRTSVP